jgi:predicted acylesterase/phospholipase RssA
MGAANARADLVDVVRGAGASAGAACEAVGAYGVPWAKARKAVTDALVNGDLLRFDLDVLGGGGLLDFGVYGELVDSIFGRVTLGDATHDLSVCVTPLNGGGPLYLSTAHHPGVLLREALVASASFLGAVTGFAKIPSLMLGKYTPSPWYYVDGGRTDNVCDSVWDHHASPNIALRLRPSADRVVRSVAEAIVAERMVTLWAANQPRTTRLDGLLVDVDGVNAWAFQQTKTEVDGAWARGYASAHRQISGWLEGRTDGG